MEKVKICLKQPFQKEDHSLSVNLLVNHSVNRNFSQSFNQPFDQHFCQPSCQPSHQPLKISFRYFLRFSIFFIFLTYFFFFISNSHLFRPGFLLSFCTHNLLTFPPLPPSYCVMKMTRNPDAVATTKCDESPFQSANSSKGPVTFKALGFRRRHVIRI